MKYSFVLSIGLVMILSAGAVCADNVNKCYWVESNSAQKKISNVVLPTYLELQGAPIGKAMATFSADVRGGSARCPLDVKKVKEGYYIERGSLEEGFTDVYKTGVAGVGIRLRHGSWTGGRILPYGGTFENAAALVSITMGTLGVEFVRTRRDVQEGSALATFKINYKIDDWNAVEINISGNTRLVSKSFFLGCAGIETINVSLGKMAIAEFDQKPAKEFNLDVLCSGMAAGTRVPVKVYFEGSSDGPGRLNLEPGGAQGVEISLSSDKGKKLPFTRFSDLYMTWIRSEPKGEIYRLPVKARFAKKASQAASPGRANATLNYILEYN